MSHSSSSRPKKDLTQGSIQGHIARIALPIFIGMAAHMLLNIVDAIYVGRLGLQETLAVLNYGFPFFYIVFAIYNGLATGTSSILARLIGAGEGEKANSTLSQMVLIALVLMLVFAILYPIVLPMYLRGMGAPAEAAGLTRSYLNWMWIGLPFTILTLTLGGGLRAEGNVRPLMMAMLLATLANLILDPLFIFSTFTFMGLSIKGLGLGVSGAAIATVLASILSAFWVSLQYLRAKTQIKWPVQANWKYREGIKSAFSVGIPSVFSQALMGFNLILLTKLSTPFGEAAVSGIGIGTRLDTLAIFPGLAIMTAVLSIVGQNFGAKNYARVRETINRGILTAIVSLTILGGIVWLSRDALVSLFKPELSAHQSALHYMKVVSPFYMLFGLNMVCSGAFQGLGRGLPYLILTAARQFLFVLPFAWLLSRPNFFGEYGIHYAQGIASSCTAVLALLWLYTVLAKLKQVPDSSSSIDSNSGTESVSTKIV